MKTKLNNMIIKGLPVMIALLAIFTAAFAGTPISEFRPLRERNGINLYYRWMEMTDVDKVRQMKAVLEINGGAEDVLRLLKDEKHALGWIPSAEQFRHLSQVNESEWVSYIQFAIPWPFADQDCILEFKSGVNETGETVIDFRCMPEYINKVNGISRMKDVSGSFVIHSQTDGHSTLECYFISEKASVIPRWITEPIITGSLLSLMEAIRSQLTEV